MDIKLSFQGRIEPPLWGNTTCTILRLTGDVADLLGAAGSRTVEGEINDHPVNLAPTRAKRALVAGSGDA